MKDTAKEATKIIHSHRNPKEQSGVVNTPLYQSSTIIFDKYQDLLDKEQENEDANIAKLKYGRYGSKTNFTLEQSIADLEGGFGAIVTSCGMSAISTTILSYVSSGDHILVSDNCYYPIRHIASSFLDKFGITVTYFDDNIGQDIEKLIQKNTKLIFLESPGSLTFEIADVKAITEITKKYNIKSILDNSWSSGIYYKAFENNIDISILAATKYINGHSDVMIGAIIAKNQEDYNKIHATYRTLGTAVAPFSAFLTLRGMRTLKVRMDQSQKSALEIAKWLETLPQISKVFYPALKSNEYYDIWQRDFTGAPGLFAIQLDKKYSIEQLSKFYDNLDYFGMGYSWGGYESLILPFGLDGARAVTKDKYENKSFARINIGLEDVDDLKEDLEEGLKRLK
ncbi:cystathionine beta-lyase [Rickettsiales bacterium]|nr:cystathionine beta-lyase [Rickettsiales bacterium]MDB2550662.1 cystathionine beta-lyase [Rickettsiales bacterium]